VKVALLGATRGMGRALARELAGRDARLCLLGRDAQQLARSARDLELRGTQGEVATAHCDLREPESFEPALEAAERALDGLDTVVVTAALFDTQEALEADTEKRQTLLTVNFVQTLQFCEAARLRLLARGGGTLCVFSSVAGERGRQRVILYGAAKAGLSHYLEGLDHKFHKQGLRVVSVKPGFVKTGSTAQLDAPPFAGEPERVAARVARAIERGQPVVYAPGIWRWIMGVIRLLPRAVLRRIDF
jgi:short-subunit dehydrogenase